jgi:hypothetical protein
MSTEQPRCAACGEIDWELEVLLKILLYASGRDPDGAFKREMTADSVHELRFWCDHCGEDASPGASALLGEVYRSHDPLRARHPTQGGLIATLNNDPAGPVVMVPVTAFVRSPERSAPD